MPKLTPEIRRKLAALARRYEVSEDAVLAAFQAVSEGGGRMAQFHHPELGGGVQWMYSGMIMIGDMFNNVLKARVDGLCTEISELLAEQKPGPSTPASEAYQSQRQMGSSAEGDAPPSAESGRVSFSTASWDWGVRESWWPEQLGTPSATGTQNDLAYAIFPQHHRLAIRFRGVVRIYDTLDHRITGIAQQQSRHATLNFTSQKGTVVLDRLPLVEECGDPSTGGS
ncbi:hypothetical protein [Methylohalobius crimeensis]|uniref:hypothetical protein n=1 Tax=Methylohalobius crimeensis TaxID=244365 RepID=UPI0003B2F30D|nr:hypothetical protein [Methylohalobius crimeensis]